MNVPIEVAEAEFLLQFTSDFLTLIIETSSVGKLGVYEAWNYKYDIDSVLFRMLLCTNIIIQVWIFFTNTLKEVSNAYTKYSKALI
jgi:hypothetical protein